MYTRQIKKKEANLRYNPRMYEEIWQKIASSKKIAILSHLVPDGDALGSAIALYLTLKRMQKKVSLVNFDSELNHKFAFLDGFETIKNDLPPNCDLLITCDCSDLAVAGLCSKEHFIINIDHHISNTNFGDINLVLPKASCGLVMQTLLQEAPIKLNLATYEALYTAIVEDTNYLQGNNADKESFQAILELIDRGVDPKHMTLLLNQSEPLALLRLKAKALNSLQLFLDGQVGVMILHQNDFIQTGAKKWMSKNFSSIPLSLSTVRIGCTAKENPNGSWKISLRSKRADVSTLALLHGGGGHKNAAAYTTDQFNIDQFINEIKGYL
jgi:phosphoesterase RecJ-like protein